MSLTGKWEGRGQTVASTKGKWDIFGSLLAKVVAGQAASATSIMRRLLQTSVSTTINVCGATFAAGTLDILSGGQITTDVSSCLFTASTITDSTGATVRAAATTDLAATTTSTFASGSSLSLSNVAPTSSLWNFNGPLTMAAGSSLALALASTPTGAYNTDVARFQSSTCAVPPATVTTSNCGTFTCTVAAVKEGTNWCRLQLQVKSAASSSSSDTNLLLLLLLLLLIPLFLCVPLAIWWMKRGSSAPAEEFLQYKVPDQEVYNVAPNPVNTPYAQPYQLATPYATSVPYAAAPYASPFGAPIASMPMTPAGGYLPPSVSITAAATPSFGF